MRRRALTAIISALSVAGGLLMPGGTAIAACAANPDALAIREMIDTETTGESDFPLLFLGVVVAHRDLGGRPNAGYTIARVAVVEHPVGFAPHETGVRFWKAPPRVGVSENLELKVDGRYALVARRLDDGTFRFDGACGESRRLNRDRFHDLVRYARTH
jgi:hypothetical protein